jgi:heme/copper-type cytochrome/quinol oxidase subunit 4
MNRLTEAAQQRRGFLTLGALAVLTVIEFAVAALPNALPWLTAVAVIKAGAILQYFMHFSALWSEEA